MDIPCITGSFEIFGRESGENYGTYDGDRYADVVYLDTKTWESLSAESNGEKLIAYDSEEPESDYAYDVKLSPWN